MSSTDLAHRATREIAIPAGARQLGARVKPIIRLGMGFKDPERGFPRKTDHFTVRGDERAVAKFKSVYGDKPKAVKLMVPSSLPLALDISYRSFVGGQSDDGGRPLALGFTNFAPLGYVGGPDMLRVWKNDGTYHEIETEGLDETGKPLDDIAEQLKIEIYATFTFTIPDVLGWGSFAQVTSKGKKSADNLVFKLGEIYGAFGSKAPWAFDREQPPMLVIKPDTALMRFEDKTTGEAGWAKSKIFVLDVVIPESFHDMQDRLVERERQLAPRGAAEALYGPPPGETPALSAGAATHGSGTTLDTSTTAGAAGGGQQAGPAATSVAGSAPDPDPDFADTDDDEVVAAAQEAAGFVVPFGTTWKGKTLADVHAAGETGRQWFVKMLAKLDQGRYPEFRAAVWAFARVYLAEEFAVALAREEAQAA